jgi:hypothetical protein
MIATCASQGIIGGQMQRARSPCSLANTSSVKLTLTLGSLQPQSRFPSTIRYADERRTPSQTISFHSGSKIAIIASHGVFCFLADMAEQAPCHGHQTSNYLAYTYRLFLFCPIRDFSLVIACVSLVSRSSRNILSLCHSLKVLSLYGIQPYSSYSVHLVSLFFFP